MSPLVALHATSVTNRESIRVRGLVPGPPKNRGRTGVYVFSDGISHPTRGRTAGARRIKWTAGPGEDVWQVAYIGPVATDIYVENALILLDSVGPELVTLVTGNDE
jgi:hypothetical protein